ncbi:MAG TPA: epoxyqueuosine reductase [Dehalococcoidia bacterium]|jgi:epoxyqueuosine reductase QueG|nr:epoxyqueuosine reductase [Dehalococcoidia bacterium]
MASKGRASAEEAILQDLIPRLDVNAVGVACLAKWEGTKLEETALKLLPEARSVVVLAMEIYPEVLDLVSPGRMMGVASTNDLLDRHVEFLSSRLTKAAYDVAKAFREAGLKALPLPAAGCPLDTRFLEAVFSYKHAGQAAGLGKIGWHSLLITPEFGPRVRLSCCLTEAALEPSSGEMNIDCESCGICLESCPAGALKEPQAGEPYVVNKFACSAFRSASGGCSECMRLCPAGTRH